mmetsp:Transcript_63079/g.173292  ORF Transcript_63079/g.173292 Transcript_63079/m.173292 type:complete len:304 (-) Transcript_63079:964-1875(-)
MRTSDVSGPNMSRMRIASTRSETAVRTAASQPRPPRPAPCPHRKVSAWLCHPLLTAWLCLHVHSPSCQPIAPDHPHPNARTGDPFAHTRCARLSTQKRDVKTRHKAQAHAFYSSGYRIFRGATLSRMSPRFISSKSIEPLPSVSSSLKSASSDSMSIADSSTTGSKLPVGATTSPEICLAISSTNCSVVSPAGPHRSRVPLPETIALCMAARSRAVHAWTSSVSPLRMAAWLSAPMSASTMPSGLSDVSSPRRCASHMSATVPCDASNSMIALPSAALPIRLDVMKPGLRCTCATSSVSMSPS